MSKQYTPPSNTQLPFTFTEGGYVAPSGEMLFRFMTQTTGFNSLSAAVQVMGLYHDETYTYVKSCPKYVVGYRRGVVQIIKGPCIYGGIRDLQGIITGTDVLTGTGDLHANISIHAPRDILGFIRVTKFKTVDLFAGISIHLSGNIAGSIRSWYRDNFVNLAGSIYGWQKVDLYATILMHPPKDLQASVFVKKIDYADLNTLIYAWHIKDLQIKLNRVFPFDLSATLDTIQPVDLFAYLKVRYIVDLKGSLKGWGIKDLSATIDIIFANDLNVKICGKDDMFKNLYCRIKGKAIEIQSLLGANIRSFIGKDLNASLIATYMSNLSGYLFSVCPKDINANIYAWHVSNLQAILNGQRGPYDLLASISPNENLRFLKASIYPVFGTRILSNLPAAVHSWETRNLTVNIGLISARNLQVILTPYLYAKDLHATIYPKMIRLSTMVKVATMVHKDLSAMINSFCVFTEYKNLFASVYTTYKSDLSVFIRTLKYIYKPSNLGASVGYADTITEVDKYKINVNVLPSEMRTFDRYKISFDIFGAVKFLSAYIKGTLRNVSLGATIIAKEIVPYNFGRIKTTEQVIHLTYSGIFKAFETVETSFKSLVNDYYYSSDGDYAWKTNRLDRWILEVKSFLPLDTSLRLKRRLHKETCLYDLTRFSTIDEAMRYAITYVTEYPQVDLCTSIYGIGRYTSLGATISPRYIKEDGVSLAGTLMPVGYTIIVGTEQGKIIKM